MQIKMEFSGKKRWLWLGNGVTVQLKNAIGTILQTTTTSTNPTTGGAGYYQFSNFVPVIISLRLLLRSITSDISEYHW
ncbi:MAG: hypothetical protein IPH96_17620 [Saprospiraceae bacterium]|nr:hypothetical protein [Saprospiraceae bacterium]